MSSDWKTLFAKKLRNRLLMLSIAVLFILIASSCTPSQKEDNKAETTDSDKSLSEQAMDWCNGYKTEEKKDYDLFNIENKTYQGEDYTFLLTREKSAWDNKLYYIQADKAGKLKKITPCGDGKESLFSYEIVDLNGDNYAAVYCASRSGNGNLQLFPLDKDSGNSYTIDNVIDNLYESLAYYDVYGIYYYKSFIYYDGKLNAEFKDINKDGYTDILLSGIVLRYERYDGDIDRLKEAQYCERTYLFDSSKERFVPSDEKLDNIYGNDGNFYTYTGYLDICPNQAEDNPKRDYDGDGNPDRVYKIYDSTANKSSYYLYFGNGTKLLLTDRDWGLFYKTETVDLTGDGVDEILFEQFSTSTKCPNLYISIFTPDNGKYIKMDMPFYGEPTVNSDGEDMLFLPLVMKKVNDTTVSIEQPDSGYQGFITAQNYTYASGDTFNEMEHLYFQEIEGVVQDYPASEMSIVDSGENGRKVLRLRSYLGDKWCVKSVDWKLEYQSGEWKITDIYQPDPIRVDLGTEFSCDLNYDKQNDVIYYGTETIQENGYDYEVPYLKINDTEFNYQYLDDNFGVYIVTCSHIGYYVFDIDVTDSYREIALLDEGPSDDPETHFFRYNGKDLIYCGNVTDFPSNSTFCSFGDGSISAKKRLGILQTWWASATWKLNGRGILEEQISDLYYPYPQITDDTNTNHAQADLSLYQKPDLKSDTVTIKKGESLQLTATDNLNWIEITSESGTKGWFYLENSSTVILPTGKARIGDILTYLNMAD